MKHLLTHEELCEVKALRLRKKVNSSDVEMLNRILGRMTPGYEICNTCLDTMRAEASSLIAFAEKQIGDSILNYDTESDLSEVKAEETPSGEFREVVVFRNDYYGRPAELTIKVPASIPPEAELTIEVTPDMIVGVNYTETEPSAKVDIQKVPDTKPVATAKQMNLTKAITEMEPAEIVAHVLEKTGVELSVDADRDELLESAADLLASMTTDSKTTQVELHANGLASTKGDVIYKYVKQQKGIELQAGLLRPDLLKAAAEALNDGK